MSVATSDRAEPDYEDEHAPVHAADQRFLKEVANHEAAVAPHFMHYNFVRIHRRWVSRLRWRLA
jgi:hypothetical protein